MVCYVHGKRDVVDQNPEALLQDIVLYGVLEPHDEEALVELGVRGEG